MSTVSVHLAPGDVSTKSFKGLTAARLIALRQLGNGTWQAEFDGALTTAEEWAVQNRLLSSSLAEEALRTQLAAFNPATATLASVAITVAALIKLANGESD